MEKFKQNEFCITRKFQIIKHYYHERAKKYSYAFFTVCVLSGLILAFEDGTFPKYRKALAGDI